MSLRLLAAFALTAALPCAAAAAQPGDVTVDSALFVEHTALATGSAARVLAPATQLTRGDRVVTLLTWVRMGGQRGGFTVTNPLPPRLAWQGSADAGEEVSVDGGRTWGRLGTLRIGARLAGAADVTHVRWHVSPDVAQGGSGTITFAGVVK